MGPVRRIHGDAHDRPDGDVRRCEISAASTLPLARVRRKTAGTAPGSVITAIIGIHDAAKKRNEPSRIATPASMPRIWSMASNQHATGPRASRSARRQSQPCCKRAPHPAALSRLSQVRSLAVISRVTAEPAGALGGPAGLLITPLGDGMADLPATQRHPGGIVRVTLIGQQQVPAFARPHAPGPADRDGIQSRQQNGLSPARPGLISTDKSEPGCLPRRASTTS
jgi:hypothetical protein